MSARKWLRSTMALVISSGVKTGRGALVDASSRDGCTTRAPDVAGSTVVLEEVPESPAQKSWWQ